MRTWMIAAILAAGMSAWGGGAQAAGEPIEVDLSNFKFEPATLHMRQGQSYVLTLRNRAHGGHSFTSTKFFAAAEVDPAGPARVHEGEIEVPGGGEVKLTVTPKQAGTFPFHCDHPLHSLMGMSGKIVVE